MECCGRGHEGRRCPHRRSAGWSGRLLPAPTHSPSSDTECPRDSSWSVSVPESGNYTISVAVLQLEEKLSHLKEQRIKPVVDYLNTYLTIVMGSCVATNDLFSLIIAIPTHNSPH